MHWQKTLTVVDAHAEGEPGRVIVGGVPPPPGRTMFEKKRYLETEADGLRRLLLNEPRDGASWSANLIVPATMPEADVGFIIMEVGEYTP